MKISVTALLLLLTLGAGPLLAVPGGFEHGPSRVSERTAGISLEQAAEQVRRQSGGRLLSATTVTVNGQQVHRIKVLTPQRQVFVREIDAGGR